MVVIKLTLGWGDEIRTQLMLGWGRCVRMRRRRSRIPFSGSCGATARKVELARSLRAQATKEEQVLWQELRERKLGGFKFRRQHIIAGYIVDFYCPETRLAVEVDGAVHDVRKEYDRKRKAALEALGVRVVRIMNEDVNRFLENVCSAVLAACKERAEAPRPERRRVLVSAEPVSCGSSPVRGVSVAESGASYTPCVRRWCRRTQRACCGVSARLRVSASPR